VIQNPSFEADQDGNGVPDCWTIGGSGTNAWTAGLTPEAHTGTFAEQISISNWTSGDRRLITTQDLGQCAPLATPGHTYTVSAYLKGQGTMKWVVYYRDSQGVWNYWAQSAAINVGASYGQLSWTTPPVPSGATALSIGVSLRSVGFYGSLSQYYGANYQPYGRSRWLGAPGPQFDFDPVGRRMLEEGRLADSCMRAKGYQPKN